MLNLSTETVTNIIKMPVDPTYKIINTHINGRRKEHFIITGISESEYHKLKCLENFFITRGDCKFAISPDDILCYGPIDFHNNSEDSKELDTFNWLDNLGGRGLCIPSRYNYDKHECSSPKSRYLTTETFKNSEICRYLHGCLGKPKLTLIFREVK